MSMASEPSREIPQAPTLLIPWPSVRPLGLPVSAAGVEEMWASIIKPMVEDRPQSMEERILMAVVRAVYAGLQGKTDGEGT